MDSADVKDLLNNTRHIKYKKGEIILWPHDKTNNIYRIRSGLVKIYRISDSGQEVIIEIYGEGNIFPIGWIINRPLQDVFFEALTPCELAIAPKKIMLEKLKSNANITFEFLCKVIEQFALYSSRVNNLELKYGRERVAYKLLLLAARFGKKRGESIVIPHFSQQDIGSLINLTREMVNIEMLKFEHKGLIKVSRKSIEIIQPKKLLDLLGKDFSIMWYDNELFK